MADISKPDINLRDELLGLRTDDQRREHPYCQECKLTCEKEGKSWDQMTSKCRGIYGEEDFEKLAALIDVPLDDVREVLDPSWWVWKYLQMKPYWYQDRYLRCTSIRRALRWGRRTGKTETICADLLRRCLNTRGLKVLAITPMKAQAKEIADRIDKFLDITPGMRNELVRSVQQPYYEFNFANKSRIRVFVAGTASGAGAGTQIRGQEGDILFIDEADYLDDDATAAILPILSDPSRHGDPVAFTISSTPSGKEGIFYRLCHDDNYRQMHVPSRFRPDWDEEKEAEARRVAKTKQQYTHEYEADWGSKSDGVFARNAIVRAQQPYRYHRDEGSHEERDWPEMVPWPHWTYCMGVDWNGPGNGTRILVLGFDPVRSKWVVAYREAVSTEDFALHVAIERIVSLNRLWNCYAVYIDAGFGQMQDEYLRNIGRLAQQARAAGEPYETADIHLAERLHTIDFGSWIEYEITDPITGQLEKVKKRKKNYMVENLQRHFELDDIWFSRNDADLKSQLMGYHAPRKGQHNELIYKADSEAGDHDLDCLILAAFAFAQEFDDALRPSTFSPPPITTHRPGEAPQPKSDPNEDPWAYERERKQQADDLPGPLTVPSRQVVTVPRPQYGQQSIDPNATIRPVPHRQLPASSTRHPRAYNRPPSRTGWAKKRGRRV